MLFYSFFKTLIGKPVTVHLKNDIELTGTLLSVDPFLNLKLDAVQPKADAAGSQPAHLLGLKTAFIRGSVVRGVEVPKEAVEVGLLQDASRVEYANPIVQGGGGKGGKAGKGDGAGEEAEQSDDQEHE